MAMIRVLRVLEYIGEEKEVWDVLRRGAVPANGENAWQGKVKIKSGLIGYPDFVSEKPSHEE